MQTPKKVPTPRSTYVAVDYSTRTVPNPDTFVALLLVLLYYETYVVFYMW